MGEVLPTLVITLIVSLNLVWEAYCLLALRLLFFFLLHSNLGLLLQFFFFFFFFCHCATFGDCVLCSTLICLFALS